MERNPQGVRHRSAISGQQPRRFRAAASPAHSEGVGIDSPYGPESNLELERDLPDLEREGSLQGENLTDGEYDEEMKHPEDDIPGRPCLGRNLSETRAIPQRQDQLPPIPVGSPPVGSPVGEWAIRLAPGAAMRKDSQINIIYVKGSHSQQPQSVWVPDERATELQSKPRVPVPRIRAPPSPDNGDVAPLHARSPHDAFSPATPVDRQVAMGQPGHDVPGAWSPAPGRRRNLGRNLPRRDGPWDAQPWSPVTMPDGEMRIPIHGEFSSASALEEPRTVVETLSLNSEVLARHTARFEEGRRPMTLEEKCEERGMELCLRRPDTNTLDAASPLFTRSASMRSLGPREKSDAECEAERMVVVCSRYDTKTIGLIIKKNLKKILRDENTPEDKVRSVLGLAKSTGCIWRDPVWMDNKKCVDYVDFCYKLQETEKPDDFDLRQVLNKNKIAHFTI